MQGPACDGLGPRRPRASVGCSHPQPRAVALWLLAPPSSFRTSGEESQPEMQMLAVFLSQVGSAKWGFPDT